MRSVCPLLPAAPVEVYTVDDEELPVPRRIMPLLSGRPTPERVWARLVQRYVAYWTSPTPGVSMQSKYASWQFQLRALVNNRPDSEVWAQLFLSWRSPHECPRCGRPFLNDSGRVRYCSHWCKRGRPGERWLPPVPVDDPEKHPPAEARRMLEATRRDSSRSPVHNAALAMFRAPVFFRHWLVAQETEVRLRFRRLEYGSAPWAAAVAEHVGIVGLCLWCAGPILIEAQSRQYCCHDCASRAARGRRPDPVRE